MEEGDDEPEWPAVDLAVQQRLHRELDGLRRPMLLATLEHYVAARQARVIAERRSPCCRSSELATFWALVDPQPEAGELMPDTAGFVQRLVEDVEAFEARAVETELAEAEAKQIARELVMLRRAEGRTSAELVPQLVGRGWRETQWRTDVLHELGRREVMRLSAAADSNCPGCCWLSGADTALSGVSIVIARELEKTRARSQRQPRRHTTRLQRFVETVLSTRPGLRKNWSLRGFRDSAAVVCEADGQHVAVDTGGRTGGAYVFDGGRVSAKAAEDCARKLTKSG